MANGFSDKEMIQMILDGQGKIQTQIDGLVTKVDQVISKGCARGDDDRRRIEELEGWRTKGIVGLIGLAIAIIVNFFRVR